MSRRSFLSSAAWRTPAVRVQHGSQLYCLQRGCAAVFSQFQAASDARKLAGSRVEHHHTVSRPFKGSSLSSSSLPGNDDGDAEQMEQLFLL